MTLGDAWEQHADEWITWARTSPHDGFAKGTWPELQAVLPTPSGLAIEFGCGEGRVGRALLRLGHAVIGIEQSPTLAQAARRGEPTVPVIRADAAAVPIADGVANLVVACMSLHDIDDLASAVREAARVLRRGGQFCVAIVHPFSSAEDRAAWDGDVARYSEPYLRQRRVEDHIERDG
ncbi:MAG: class I SAM-dependent methyltransferase [Acidimicrobiales bacterium]